ncbi:MAG TPA: thiolase family protein [Thermoanaerobaculia bacterium]
MSETVLVSYARTAFGKFGGALRDVPGIDLAATAISGAIARGGIDPAEVDEVFGGCCAPAEAGVIAPVVARRALLKAGLPASVPSLTLDRACCSSLAALQLADRAIRAGDVRVAVVFGVENLSRVPLVASPRIRWGTRVGPVTLEDALYRMEYPGFTPVSVDAGEVAVERGIGREEQDEWALGSQLRYARALAEGIPAEEIVPLTLPDGKVFDADELPRPATTREALAKLPTVYGSPTVTAGNAPGLDAGAAALVVMSEAEARRRGLRPLARLLAYAAIALEPRLMAEAPAAASRRALAQARLELAALDRVEINEAFAAVPLVSTKLLAGDGAAALAALREKTNADGGAIAIGHPVGASGARIAGTLALALRRRGGGRGLAAICGGLAQGDAAILEAVA